MRGTGLLVPVRSVVPRVPILGIWATSSLSKATTGTAISPFGQNSQVSGTITAIAAIASDIAGSARSTVAPVTSAARRRVAAIPATASSAARSVLRVALALGSAGAARVSTAPAVAPTAPPDASISAAPASTAVVVVRVPPVLSFTAGPTITVRSCPVLADIDAVAAMTRVAGVASVRIDQIVPCSMSTHTAITTVPSAIFSVATVAPVSSVAERPVEVIAAG